MIQPTSSMGNQPLSEEQEKNLKTEMTQLQKKVDVLERKIRTISEDPSYDGYVAEMVGSRSTLPPDLKKKRAEEIQTLGNEVFRINSRINDISKLLQDSKTSVTMDEKKNV